jgi:DNA-binding GntR family transcriptional regulator
MEQVALDRPPSLTDAVVAHIRDAIIRGAYAPGQPLTEAQLSDELGTSRGTVREALRVLAGLRLVTRSAHRGAVVSTLTARDAEEIYTLRASLESFAAQLAVGRGYVDEAALETLDGHVTAIARAAADHDVTGMVAADMEFHTALSSLSHHALLCEHLAAIQVHSRRLLFYSDLYRPQPEVVVRRHQDLLALLRGGDAKQVSLAVDEHITGPNRDIVAMMLEREVAPDERTEDDA